MYQADTAVVVGDAALRADGGRERHVEQESTLHVSNAIAHVHANCKS
jgi:hypothetical protein